MQKIKNPILCWIVIFSIFIRPTPAHAIVPLAAVAVGAVIAATGVMVAGAGVYKPPTFAQANAVVDSVTGDITRKVVVARAFADGVSSGMRGYVGQYTLDYGKVVDWVKAHPVDFPALIGPINGSLVEQPPVIASGFVLTYGGSGNFSLTTKISGPIAKTNQTDPTSAYPVSLGGNARCLAFSWAGSWQVNIVEHILNNNGSYSYDYSEWRSSSTTLVPLPLPVDRHPELFAPAYPNTETGQDETDRIAAENPAAIKSEPVPFTPEQIQEAMKQAEKEMLDATADAAEAAAAADPTNTALQIAAQQARAAADQATIQAEAAKAEVETKPDEEVTTDTPPPAGPAPEADLALDFSPFLGLQDKAMSKFPFSMVSSLGSLFSGLTSAPVTPSMDVPMPWGIAPKQITLSHWDDFAGKWRMMIALFFHASCIYAIIKRYS